MSALPKITSQPSVEPSAMPTSAVNKTLAMARTVVAALTKTPIAKTAEPVDPKYTPLTQAIDQDKSLIEIQKLISKQNINQIDPEGYTPLIRAVRKKNIPLVTLLLKAGAHINGRDRLDYAPIHYCQANKPMIRHLARHGADLNLPHPQMNLLLDEALSCNDTDWYNELVQLGADGDFFTEVAMRKELAHIWRISGNTTLNSNTGMKTVSLLAWTTFAGCTMLEGYLKAFLAQSNIFSSSERAEIEEAIGNIAYFCSKETVMDTLQRIKTAKTKPVLFFGEGAQHSFSFCFAGGRLYIANFGEGGDNKYGIVTYQIDPSKVNLELIAQLKRPYETMELLLNVLTSFNVKLLEEECVVAPDQTAPNCTWESGALGASRTLFHYYKKKGFDQFVEFCQKLSLKKYKEESTNYDIGLLNTIQMRIALINSK